MKIHWGYLIASAYLGFSVLIIFLVWNSSSQQVDLVADDYYAQEVKYQQTVDAGRRTSGKEINISQTTDKVVVAWTNGKVPVNGAKITCYRPSSRQGDFTVTATADTPLTYISKSKFMTGKYTIKISWEVQGKQHFYQENIFIQ